jgi:FKBP-type peptidyl-prolyl cis-trans isomerase 2
VSPWPLKPEIALVLDFNPMLAGSVFAVDTKVTDKLKLKHVALRSLQAAQIIVI